MSHTRVPVLVTRHGEGIYIAKAVEGPEVAGCGKTMAEAFDSVRRLLQKLGQKGSVPFWPDEDVCYEMTTRRVDVRVGQAVEDDDDDPPAKRGSRRRVKKRKSAAGDLVPLRIRVVIGRDDLGGHQAWMPDIDRTVLTYREKELLRLIDESATAWATTAGAEDFAAVAAGSAAGGELRIVTVRLTDQVDRDRPDPAETLRRVATAVGRRTRSAGPLADRGDLYDRLARAMAGRSVAVCGPTGGGKSTVIGEAAKRFIATRAKKERDEGLPKRTTPLVWQTSPARLLAGLPYLGQWQERVQKVAGEIESIGGVLVVDSLIELVRLGGSSASDSIGAMLMPLIRRGEIRVVAETTAEQLDATRRTLPGLAECFEVMPVAAIGRGETVRLADQAITRLRQKDVPVIGEVARVATELVHRFEPYRTGPRPVLQLIEQAAIGADTSSPLDVRRLRDRFAESTGLPMAILDDAEMLTADQIRDEIQREVIGQPAAVGAVSDVVLRIKAGLNDPARPVATMLLCGPTGTGKTQLARTLCRYLFGGVKATDAGGQSVAADAALIRLDMSEYAGAAGAEALTTAADGSVAPWVGRLRDRPMSVLLLDEFEKASGEVHDALLSALDEGRLTDRFGRTTTLCGAIILMTSNVGVQSTGEVGFGPGDPRRFARSIEKYFRPEFLNRIDEVVAFEPLGTDAVAAIVEKELRDLAAMAALADRRVRLTWDEQLVAQLAAEGIDPLLGARPLQRTIARRVVGPLARRLLTEPLDGRAIRLG